MCTPVAQFLYVPSLLNVVHSRKKQEKLALKRRLEIVLDRLSNTVFGDGK